MDVSVRELKAKLSEYLRRAENGEVLTVTERGRPKAVIGPLPGLRIEQGIAEGWITPASRPGPLKPIRGWKSSRRVLDVLAEDRDE